MIARLSNTITAIKEYVYRHTVLRYVFYLAVALGLLLFWLYAAQTEIGFIYSAF